MICIMLNYFPNTVFFFIMQCIFFLFNREPNEIDDVKPTRGHKNTMEGDVLDSTTATITLLLYYAYMMHPVHVTMSWVLIYILC